MLVDGAGTVVSADLGPLAALGGVSATGTAGGTFAFRARGDHQTFASKLQLEHVDVAGIRAEHLTLDVAVQDLAAGEGLEAAVYGAAGSVGALAVDDLRITVSGALSDMTFSAGADGSLEPHRLELALAGQAAVAEDQFRITLASGTGSIGPERVDLVRPLEARIGRDAVRVELRELALRLVGGGQVEGSVSWGSGGFVGGLDGAQIPLALLGHLARVPAVSGFLDVAITFDTRRATSSAVLDAAVSDLVLTGVAADHALSADLSGRWDGARLDMQAMVRGGFGEPVEARLRLPVRPSAEGIPRLSRRDPIDGTLSWRGNVAELWAVLPPSSHVVEGDVDLQLGFAGTVDAPRVSGHAEVAGGRWDQVDAGLALTDITVRAALADSAVITLRGSASDGGQGRIEGDATVHLDPGPAIEAVVRVNRAALLQRDDVAAWISGTGDLQGPWNDLSFRGAFTIDEAEVRLVDVMPPDAVELDGAVIASVERKSLQDLVSTMVGGKLWFLLADLAAVERSALVVEDRYSQVFKLDRVRPAVVAEGLADAAVRFPSVPIVFAETRALAQEWTFRFLGAALAEHHRSRAGDVLVSALPAAGELPNPEPTTADVRAWARSNGLTVPDRGRLRPEVWSAYRLANPA